MKRVSSRHVLLASAVVIFACLSLSASDTVIVVRVIMGKTGAPVKGAVVYLSGNNGLKGWPFMTKKGPVTDLGASHVWTGKTDATGSVKFDINEPTNSLPGYNGMASGTAYHTSQLPVTLYGGARGYWPCLQDWADREQETEEIVGRGVAVADRCDRRGKLKGRFTPKPGEWIMFVTPMTWWDRAWRQFMLE